MSRSDSLSGDSWRTSVTKQPVSPMSRGIVEGVPVQLDAVTDQAEAEDVGIVVLGEPWYLHEFGPESLKGPIGDIPDRNQRRLSEEQQNLVEAISQTGAPTVLDLVTGRPLVSTDVLDEIDGILVTFYPGLQGGGPSLTLFLVTQIRPVDSPSRSHGRLGDLPVRHDWLPHLSPLETREHRPSYYPLFRVRA